MSAYKYASIFPRQIEAIDYIFSRQIENIVYMFARQIEAMVHLKLAFLNWLLEKL